MKLTISTTKKFSVFLAITLLLLVQANSWAQYCTGINLGGGACNAGQLINSVSIAGTGFNSSIPSCVSGTNGALTTFPASGNTTANLMQGQTYIFSVTTDAANIISIWIDYDHNLVYDSTEWTQVCLTSAAGIPNSVSITIPFGSYTGATGMRVRSRQNNVNNGAVDACTQFGSGETEDYTITILAGAPCTTPPIAGNAVSSVTNACSGTFF